ncbi:XRE family transcriptional regulator [Lactobacillus gallinarum]|nr:XRE family transcriptional regulator [Lactobacillus gallinarum]
MIDIKKFVQIRKKQKLSQTELCDGICTQSTLSKFENNCQVPSLKILNELCNRLHIEVGNIINRSNEQRIAQLLFDADFSFINYDYTKILNLLSEVNEDTLKRKTDQVHYQFLRGQYALKSDRNEMSALFYFNNILTTKDLPKNDIYRLLALNGCSQIYAKQGETKKAEHYYSQVLKNIKDVEINNPLTTLHALAILCDASEFYGQREMYKESNSLLRYAYKIGTEKHVIFYMARILLQQGINDIAQNKDKTIISQHLHDACAFARINRNRITLNKARKLLKQLNE